MTAEVLVTREAELLIERPTEVLVETEQVAELLEVARQGPPGPSGALADITADPLAYYILAKA